MIGIRSIVERGRANGNGEHELQSGEAMHGTNKTRMQGRKETRMRTSADTPREPFTKLRTNSDPLHLSANQTDCKRMRGKGGALRWLAMRGKGRGKRDDRRQGDLQTTRECVKITPMQEGRCRKASSRTPIALHDDTTARAYVRGGGHQLEQVLRRAATRYHRCKSVRMQGLSLHQYLMEPHRDSAFRREASLWTQLREAPYLGRWVGRCAGNRGG